MTLEKNVSYIRKLGERVADQKRVYPTLNLPRGIGFEPGDMVEVIESEYNGKIAIIVTEYNTHTHRSDQTTTENNISPHAQDNRNDIGRQKIEICSDRDSNPSLRLERPSCLSILTTNGTQKPHAVPYYILREKFLLWIRARMSEKTAHDYIRYLDRYIGNVSIQTESDIKEISKTVTKGWNWYAKAMRNYIHFLEEEKIISTDQAKEWKHTLKMKQTGNDTWVPEEQIIQNVIEACQNSSKLLVFYVAICSGIRVSEIERLFDDFDISKLHDVENISYYDIDWKRGNKNANKAFIPRTVANMIRRHTGNVSIRAAQRYFQIQKVPLKYCRNFFINLCTKEGVPDSIIEYMIGHTGGSVLSINYIQKHQRAIEWYQKIEPKITEIIKTERKEHNLQI